MRIIVDADACPVKNIIDIEAKKRNIPVIMVSNINHNITSDYAEVIWVDETAEAADFAIINMLQPEDLVVTQDYGLASLVLGKKAQAISPLGMVYDLNNIDSLLMQRHINAKARKAGIKTSNPKKRKGIDDEKFKNNFNKLIDKK
ncbi:MAG: YaiI/YqxD family protein [Syntrophomonadaceae bacterium]|nr:YaiI/YqxD family protein [Syntrophomonadaceae bacterium]